MTEDPAAADSTISARQRLIAMILLTLASTLNYFDRMLLPALAHPIKNELRLSDTELGILTGAAFALFYAAFGLPLARLADRKSRKLVIVGSLGIWSIMTAGCGLAQNYWQLLVARFGVGAGEAGCIPPSHSLVSDYFPPERRAGAIGWIHSGAAIGITAGFAIGGYLGTQFGWRSAFLIAALPGLLLSALTWFHLREPARRMDLKQTAAPSAGAPELWESLSQLWRNSTYRWLAIAASLSTFLLYGVAQWMPIFFIRSHGLSVAAVGLFFGIAFGLGTGLGIASGGWIANRLAKRGAAAPLLASIVATAGAVAVYAAVLWSPSPKLAFPLMFVAAILGAAPYAPVLAQIQNVVTAEIRATASAVALFLSSVVGIGLGPVAVGALSDAFTHGGWANPLQNALSLSLISGGLLMFALWRAAAAAEPRPRASA